MRKMPPGRTFKSDLNKASISGSRQNVETGVICISRTWGDGFNCTSGTWEDRCCVVAREHLEKMVLCTPRTRHGEMVLVVPPEHGKTGDALWLGNTWR